MKTKYLVNCAVCLLASLTEVFAVSVSLAPSSDATISDQSPIAPLGTGTTLQIGTSGKGVSYRSLFSFNFASMPTNAVVTNVTLTLRVIETSVITNGWVDLHRLNRSWTESVVTWTNRLSPPASWSVFGASAPIDYINQITQSNFIADTGSYVFASNDRMVADVQNWVTTPGTNFGWILISELQGTQNSVKKFGSRENTLNAPQLTVEYTVPAVQPIFTDVSLINNQLSCFTWEV